MKISVTLEKIIEDCDEGETSLEGENCAGHIVEYCGTDSANFTDAGCAEFLTEGAPVDDEDEDNMTFLNYCGMDELLKKLTNGKLHFVMP